jgi:hypothetical protein
MRPMIRFSIAIPHRLSLVRIERHANGPRVYVLGGRVHEFELGFALLLGAIVAAAMGAEPLWLSGGCQGASGAWLVIKDWPDLFPSTRDTACWRFGIHRPPLMPWHAQRPSTER